MSDYAVFDSVVVRVFDVIELTDFGQWSWEVGLTGSGFALCAQACRYCTHVRCRLERPRPLDPQSGASGQWLPVVQRLVNY